MTSRTRELSIRRSSRRTKSRPDYCMGDVVEINETVNDTQVVIGRLVSKVSGSSTGPLWTVMFENHDGPATMKEILESDLGEILEKQTPVAKKSIRGKRTASSTNADDVKKTRKRGLAKSAENADDKDRDETPPETSSSSPSNNGSSSEGQSKRGGKKRRKTVTFGRSNLNTTERPPSESSEQTDTAKKESQNGPDLTSARDIRVNRRQSGGSVKKETTTTTTGKTSGIATAAPPRNGKQRHAASMRMRQKGRFVSSGKGGKPMRGSAVSGSTAASKDVIRVPMLTGTLFLYRGIHRRAEFVRSV